MQKITVTYLLEVHKNTARFENAKPRSATVMLHRFWQRIAHGKRQKAPFAVFEYQPMILDQKYLDLRADYLILDLLLISQFLFRGPKGKLYA